MLQVFPKRSCGSSMRRFVIVHLFEHYNKDKVKKRKKRFPFETEVILSAEKPIMFPRSSPLFLVHQNRILSMLTSKSLYLHPLLEEKSATLERFRCAPRLQPNMWRCVTMFPLVLCELQ